VLYLYATLGLPGSGKTTWARLEQSRDRSIVLVNKDLIRGMMFAAYTPENEKMVEAVRDAAIYSALTAGRSVICHDTNTAKRHLDHLAHLAAMHSARFVVRDFTHIDMETCIARQAGRPLTERVPAEAIRRMAMELSATV
jgi:predicted kinase